MTLRESTLLTVATPHIDPVEFKGPPFDQLKVIRRVSKHCRGQDSIDHAGLNSISAATGQEQAFY